MVQPLTPLSGLFPDGNKLVQHFLSEERDLASVDNINHTVNHVVQGRLLLVAGSIRHERSRGTELRNK